MEEKKTKKMTKAEAFEYLSGKKVACDISNEELVQLKLFEVGIRWRNGSTHVIKEIYVVFLFIDLRGKITHCGGNRVYFYNHDYEEISADDILSIEIVEEEKEPLDKYDDFACRVAKIQEKIDDDEVCIITKGNFITIRK